MTRKAIKQKLTSQSQMSEAFILAAMLAFCGGFQDAYTYIVRDKVFANAQTGNVVLMSVDLFNGRILTALRYLIPLSAFAAGIFIADNIQFYYKHSRKLHWRQAVLIAEMLIMAAAGFFPASLDLAANCLISFSCAMQVQSFRTVSGNAYASTMCIGNLRSAVCAVSAYAREKDRSHKDTALYYFGVILVFAVGAAVCGLIAPHLGIHTIWLSLPILLAAFLMMELDRK
jgi:uncharacterized membrane protein YoaK (UPF0700 family)